MCRDLAARNVLLNNNGQAKVVPLLMTIRTDLKAMFAKYCTIYAYLFLSFRSLILVLQEELTSLCLTREESFL